MNGPEIPTACLHHWLDRMQAGDAAARNELMRLVSTRLEQLARQMLRRFPNVRRFNETGDVVQGAVVRLLRSLEHVRPPSVRDFFNLAANHIRSELLDLARRHSARPATALTTQGGEPVAPETASEALADLDRWYAFHDAVEQLPAEEREVVSLVFYHGRTQAQVAELFGVTERTIRRRWQAACVKLSDTLHGALPDL
jgi:RNA polymerase sigma-70 factor (ECF subfamily)